MAAILALFAALAANISVATVDKHDIEISFDPSSHTIQVKDVLTVSTNESEILVVFLNGGFSIDSVLSDGVELDFRWAEPQLQDLMMEMTQWDSGEIPDAAKALVVPLPESDNPVVEIAMAYHGVVFDQPKAASFSRQQIADQTTGIVSEQGVYLAPSTCWYPQQPKSLVVYRIKIIAPTGYEVITEADLIGKEESGEQVISYFGSSYPFDGIHLIAGKYVVETIDHHGIDVQMFFFPGSESLVSRYLEASKDYLEMYEEMLGSYPYSKFAVVENFFPSGYGMPSFTLLGSQVIRLPFIVGTSLGHEIAHNWWGNSVYVDAERGNWCEGLTTYCADYYYKELEGEAAAADYRRTINRDYSNYVGAGNDFALRDFRERHDPASRAVGYGKSMMVFHTVRRSIGDDKFFAALKEIVKRFRWKYASWEDLVSVFSEIGGKDMSWILTEYVDRVGAPFIELDNVSSRTKAANQSPVEGWLVTFELAQSGQVYRLNVPVHIETANEVVVKYVELNSESGRFSLEVGDKPLSISIDPDCWLFRRLHREEIPPVLSLIFGGPQQLIVLPDSGDDEKQKAYGVVAEALNRNKVATVKTASEITDEELKTSTLIILGGPSENSVAQRWENALPNGSIVNSGGFVLAGEEHAAGSLAAVACFRNPLNEARGAVVMAANDLEGVKSLGNRLLHYGKYSYLGFKNGKNIIKGTWTIESSPLIDRFEE